MKLGLGNMTDKFLQYDNLPEFHITGGKGWINDPNGPVVFNGEYHVFFQFYPHGVEWGPMHWGHVKSKDLTHWERLPIALYPDENDDGCFSGSAIVWKDKLWILYTSYKENGGGENIRQLQALASSDDGVHFTKHGIVIGERDLPAEYTPVDFRDPKILRHGDNFYALIAARRRGGTGRILLFRSDDLFDWKYVCELLHRDCKGVMIECPDYCESAGVLTYCEQNKPREGHAHVNLHTTVARVGKLDYAQGFVETGRGEPVDYGFDFYAPQTFEGSPIMIGWMNMWERNNPSAKYDFAGMLTVPRKIEVKNNRLWQTPVYTSREVLSVENGGKITDRLIVGSVKINMSGLRAFKMKMRMNGRHYAMLTLDGDYWVFDRSNAGEKIVGVEKDEDSIAQIRRMPYEKGVFNRLEIVVDRFSVEIFADGRALSSVIYPELDADGLELELDADNFTYRRFDIA